MTRDVTAPPPAGFVDMLPCEVTMPDGFTVIHRARVVAHQQRVVVFAENPSEPMDVTIHHDLPVVAVLEWPDQYAPVRQQRLVVETGLGTMIVNALPGCGCGNSGLSAADAASVYPEKIPAAKRR
jgi:hypothetical protein